jgi:predicted RNase H-like HicB family nuclease
MKFMVELEPGEDGWVVASCPSLPGCHTQGRTREEALVRIEEAIHAWLEAEELEAAQQAHARQHEVTTVEVAA